ncbi:BTB/POZ domain-containing protein At3g05675 [Ricinus communis]|uniref:Protein binding protein, putative n=1 Tax=Ricinus communis TaxID=3988 RepID=B9RYR3_RICCO|nr:BTB/POZ domain-containing protein At3g05675 [Ricinus communis]EEF43415.1 protein binding protein, putative [Ricinus communis]|eukprot:XP_002518882.1 BTB/POZ domain-containing protein At3g05675 [Ricinus communis]
MEKTGVAKPCRLGDQSTSDITVHLRNSDGRPEIFYSHSSILVKKSKFFAHWCSNPDSGTCFEIHCSEYNYDHHVNFLRLLYLPAHLLLDSLESVKSAVGILEVSVAFSCEEITRSCIQYLEAVPWEDKEEEEILKAVSQLGPIAMPIISRIQPVDIRATKNVFVSAIRFATSTGGLFPPFGDELRLSAQEQVEYMLGEDEDTPLVTADDEVKSVVRMGLSKIFSSFEKQLSSLLLDFDLVSEAADAKILQTLSDLQWMCNILPKMDLMKEFVSNWVDISGKVLGVTEDNKLDYVMWGLKIKLIEVTGKVLEAVGYGNVILSTPCRVRLLNTWLPYIRKLKPLLDMKYDEDSTFPYKMDEDLCQSIEGAIVSLILALPSNDQADILADWMKADQVRYPDLSEAFEVWCYRTKSAKRRLVEGLDKVGNASAFDLSI